MSPLSQKMTFDVRSERVDMTISKSYCKNAEIRIDTDPTGSPDAFNPAELLLAALSACMIKGVERISPILDFKFDGIEVRLHGVRQDIPPRMESIRYEVIVDTKEADHRLELLHKNIKQFGTVYNTVLAGTDLSGTIRRKG
ncbi:MAG: OsmC family protein [Bdellovibrionales bacterium]|nr:OsmC family protein [Bdellovibrionales bacterium]